MRKMKQLKFSALIAIIFASMMFTACGDDDNNDEQKSAYIGSYTIKSAKLAEALPLEMVIGGKTMTVPIPVGQDFTDLISNSLLNVIPDCNAQSSLIELKEDFTMYLSCATSEWELNAGTWQEKDNGTTLVFNFNQNAIPSSPSGFQLTATDVKLENGIMSSTAVIPIPWAVLAVAMEKSGQATLTENNPDPIMFKFDLEFEKKK